MKGKHVSVLMKMILVNRDSVLCYAEMEALNLNSLMNWELQIGFGTFNSVDPQKCRKAAKAK